MEIYLFERELLIVAVVVTLAVTESIAGIPTVALSSTPTAKELSSVIDRKYNWSRT